MIFADLAAASKKEVIMELAERVQDKLPNLQAEQIYALLMARESLGSTGIGEGIAIPHGKVKDMTEIIVCFGRSLKGVPFDAMDNKPAHLFFLLLAPEESTTSYLKGLAELSRCLKNPATHEKLMQARNQEELAVILRGSG